MSSLKNDTSKIISSPFYDYVKEQAKLCTNAKLQQAIIDVDWEVYAKEYHEQICRHWQKLTVQSRSSEPIGNFVFELIDNVVTMYLDSRNGVPVSSDLKPLESGQEIINIDKLPPVQMNKESAVQSRDGLTLDKILSVFVSMIVQKSLVNSAFDQINRRDPFLVSIFSIDRKEICILYNSTTDEMLPVIPETEKGEAWRFYDPEQQIIEVSGVEEIPPSIGEIQDAVMLTIYSPTIAKLPSSISKLTNLKAIELSMFEMKEFPASILSLNQLTSLDIQGCRIRRLPDDFCNLTNLRSLSINFTLLENLPETFPKLERLDTLDLSNNRILELPLALLNMKALKRLSINGENNTTLKKIFSKRRGDPDSDFGCIRSINGIGTLSSLEELELSGGGVLAHIPEEIASLKNLKKLDLGSSGIVAIPAAIAGLQNLQLLDLSDNIELTLLPPEIGELQNLRELRLDGTMINNIPETIFNLKNLEKVFLPTEAVSGETFRKIRTAILKTNPSAEVTLGKLEEDDDE